MNLLTWSISIGLLGVLIYSYGVFYGFHNWDDWAWSMVIRSTGFVTIVVSLTLLIVWWAER